jgi:hypothetical protein
MAYTSGTTAFNLDLSELVEEAFERAGAELRTGYDLRTARRSLNIMFADWANRGINMWTMEQGVIPLNTGQATYLLPNDTVDLLEHVIRTQANSTSNQADLTITRISVSTYATIPNKLTQGRPIQLLVSRYDGQDSASSYQVTSTLNSTATTITLSSTTGASPTNTLPGSGIIKIDSEYIYYNELVQTSPSNGSTSGVYTLYNCIRGFNDTTAASHLTSAVIYKVNTPTVTVWPTPNAGGGYQLVYWRLRRTQDAGDGSNVMDVPFRFIPCMAAGLAYYIAGKIPSGYERLPMLKQQYDEAWALASEEDREKAAVRFVPRQQFIGSGP